MRIWVAAAAGVVGYYGGRSTAPQVGPTPSTVTETVTQTQAVTQPPAKEVFKIATINAGPSGTQWGQAVLAGQPLSDKILAPEFPRKLLILEFVHPQRLAQLDPELRALSPNSQGARHPSDNRFVNGAYNLRSS